MMISDKTTRADLHLHTTASDGALSPSALVEAAHAARMQLIAITDHDTIEGVREAQHAGTQRGLPVVPGIELSTGHGEEIHVLGYGLDPDSSALARFLDTQMQNRETRMLAMLDKLRVLGLEITPEEARSEKTGFIGRMMLADAMVQRGYVQDTAEAFDRFLSPGASAYVLRERVTVAEGIAALASFGALPVLAHPGRSGLDSHKLSALLPEWIEAGLRGIEAYHASHGEAEALAFERIARKNGLLVTGGSDSHGRPRGAQIGDHVRAWRTLRKDVQAFARALPTGFHQNTGV